MNSAMFLLLWCTPPYTRVANPANTIEAINNFAGRDRLLHERECSGRPIAMLVAPVIRIRAELRGETARPPKNIS